MAVEIRKCTLDNLKTLQDISRETFTDTFGEYNTPNDLKNYLDDAYNDMVLTKELSDINSWFYFLYYDNKLAGYLKLNILDAQSENMSDNYLEIQRIYIRVPFKRLGLGTKLLEFSQEKARQLKKDHVWLGVWEKNFPAQKFYERMNFTRYSEHKFVMGESVQTDYILIKKMR